MTKSVSKFIDYCLGHEESPNIQNINNKVKIQMYFSILHQISRNVNGTMIKPLTTMSKLFRILKVASTIVVIIPLTGLHRLTLGILLFNFNSYYIKTIRMNAAVTI